MRALRSPAINDRASVESVCRKLSLNPRTPTSAATPMATDSTTKPNLPGADFKSRHAIAAARFQLNTRLLPGAAVSAIGHLLCCLIQLRFVRQRVFNDLAVLENDFAIGPAC